jgi:hypothetical protein
MVAALLLVACQVDVRKQDAGDKAEVDIRTPVGDLAVRTNVDAPDTGLPIFAGARPVRTGNDGPDSANVSVGLPFLDVKVVAAKYEADADPDTVVDFYRNALRKYGDVSECRGEVDFKGQRSRMPSCKENARSRQIQLVAGTEERHRIVSVEPRGDRTEFALVYLQTRVGS